MFKQPLPRGLLWIAAALVTCLSGLYFRLYPLTHNVSSDAYEQGTMLVLTKIRQTVAAQVTRQFPDLPQGKKDQLIKEEMDKLIREHGRDLRKAFDDAGQQILVQSGKQKHYLLESDAYYFLSLVEEILEKGHFGSQTKGSKYFNPMMLAPLGYWQPQTWHPYIGVAVYKIVHFFQPDSDLMFGVGFTAVFLFILVVGAFFLACHSLECGIFPAFIASIFFVLAPIYMQRSTFANFDDDAYNMLFPLMIFTFIFHAINCLKNIRLSLLFAGIAGFSMAFYALFWAGWGFIWGLSAAGLGLAVIITFFKERALFKPFLFLSMTLVIAPFVATGLFFGFREVGELIIFALNELKKFISPTLKDWPDLFIVVGELKKSSLGKAMELMGGPILFLGGSASMAWAGLRILFTYDAKTAKTAILAVSFAVTLMLSLNAERFTLLCLTPLALLFAFGLNELWSRRHDITLTLGLKSTPSRNIFAVTLASIFLLSTIIPLTASSRNIRSMLSPIFNSAWERALTRLRDHSPANSIINTWWSPGHFVKAIARRRVTFDGASIKGEQAYWLTRVYMSQTEEEAIGILRMINVSSNNAAEFLQTKNIPLSTAVPLLLKATRLERNDAYAAYRQFLPVKDADTLIAMTHGQPPPSYVLIYNENVDGNVLLGYLGKWNFRKIEELNNNPQAVKKIPSRNAPGYVDFIWSLVGGQYRQSPVLNLRGRNGDILNFDHGVSVNTKDMTVTVSSPQFGNGIPESVFYAGNNEVVEKKLAGANLTYSAVVFMGMEGSMHCVLTERIIANSLIARMYYFQGLGLHRFKPFALEKDLTGRTKICIFEVLWH